MAAAGTNGPVPLAALTRIHSILQHSVSMREVDIEHVSKQCECLLGDEKCMASPQIRACLMADGWLPIASFLNYSPLGREVWPFGGVGVVADCLEARGSHIVELSGDRSCVRKKPLRVQVRSQLEYIFSDVNYHKCPPPTHTPPHPSYPTPLCHPPLTYPPNHLTT